MPPEPYHCPVCNKSYALFKEWRYHCHRHHNGEDPRQNDGEKDPELVAHEMAQSYQPPTGEFGCTWDDCDRKFRKWSDFWTHIEVGHGKVGAVLPSLATQLDLEWELLKTNHTTYVLVCRKRGLDPYD